MRRAIAATPWRAKIVGKLLLSRLPVGYGAWSRLSLFKWGSMDDPAYAYAAFTRHFLRALPERDFVALEVGPGDTVSSALVAHAYGARRSYLVDVGDFARQDIEPYLDLARFLREKGLPVPDLDGAESRDDVLERCSATYLTGGVESLRELPDGSVDFSWSQHVLEHVRTAQLPDLLRQLRRLTPPGGASSHDVDLEDHLASGLNNLRFSERMWESRLFVESGFYTNRLRPAMLVRLFEEAGFQVEVVKEASWDALPTPRGKLAPPFRDLPEEDLLVRNLEVVLRPAAD